MKINNIVQKALLYIGLLLVPSISFFAAGAQVAQDFRAIGYPNCSVPVNHCSTGAYRDANGLAVLRTVYGSCKGNRYGLIGCIHETQNEFTPRFHSEIALLQHLEATVQLRGITIYIKNSQYGPCVTPYGEKKVFGEIEDQKGKTCHQCLREFSEKHDCTIYVRWVSERDNKEHECKYEKGWCLHKT
jgi:hypothetical protein